MSGTRMLPQACGLGAVGLLVSAPPLEAQITLTEFTAGAGLQAKHDVDDPGIPGSQDYMTGGLAVGDFNDDGWMAAACAFPHDRTLRIACNALMPSRGCALVGHLEEPDS